MAKYFGTDGFRGETNKTLTVEYAYKIGRFLDWYYGREHDGREEGDKEQGDREQVGKERKTCRVIIGKDTQRSSYVFECALATGLTASGADAYLLHMTTTPSISYVARTEGFGCSVMISVSHNPHYDNGIKLTNAQGERMDEDAVLRVEACLDGISEEIPLAVRKRIGHTVGHATGRSQYTGYLISLAIRSYKNMRMGLDCVNGNAWVIARSVSDALGASTCVINNGPDGLNINTSYGSTHMEDLIQSVKEEKLDVGFAFDGDANRCLCVDEKGNPVNGDLTLYIYGRYMEERGKLAGNRIVTAAMSNFGLYETLDGAGIEYGRTAVGDKYMHENMALDDYHIGSERSDHIVFRKYAAAGDGVLMAIKVMEVVLKKRQPLSRLAEPVHIYPQVLENTRVRNKQAIREDRDVQDTVNRVEQELGIEGRVLVRESGTEPIMCVMVETRDGYKCREYVGRTIWVMVDEGHQDVLS